MNTITDEEFELKAAELEKKIKEASSAFASRIGELRSDLNEDFVVADAGLSSFAKEMIEGDE